MNSTTEVNEPIEQERTVGAVIRRAREEQSKTKAQALQVLNLRRDQLDALESNDFQKLPGDAFVRGYIRAYARWLQIDSDELLAVYLQQSGKDGEAVPTSGIKPRKSVSKKNDNGRLISAALVVLVLISSFWLYSSRNDTVIEPEIEDSVIAVDTFSGESLSDEETGSAVDDTLTDTESGQNWENPFGAEDTDVQVTDSTVELAPESDVEQVVETEVASTASDVVATVSQTPSNNSAAATSIARDAGGSFRGIGPDRLVFTFQEDCWLEVKNANDTVIYSAVRKAGRTLRLRGTAPFRVKVGNAPAVSSLLFNDAPIEVKATNRRNMARLTLGG